MATRRDWTELEDIACLYLYLSKGRRQIDDSDPDLVKLAEALSRTPGAVSFKSANFRFIDPYSKGKGFEHGSKMDAKVWTAYSDDIERAKEIFDLFIQSPDPSSEVIDTEQRIDSKNYDIPDSYGRAAVRTSQFKIRANALSIYGESCSLCHIDLPMLLVASHVVPWKADQKIRADPRNVILLCAMHDKMFDRGIISIDENYRVIGSTKLNEYPIAERHVKQLEGKKMGIKGGGEMLPKQDYLEYHRKHVFII